MSKFRDLLKIQIDEEYKARGADFVQLRNGDPHENGYQRGYLVALNNVLDWMQDIERKINEG